GVARRGLANVEEAIFVAIHQGAEEHAAYDAEDGGVGADAERERDDDSEGEALGAPQRPQREPDVAAERRGRVERAAVPHPAHRLADGRNVAQLAQRGQPRGFRILPALDPLLDADCQMPADLVVKLTLVWAHRLLLVERRGIHDAADCMDELRPAVLLAEQLFLS